MIEVTQQINSVRREVGSRVLEAGEARTVKVAQTYGTGLDDLWDACTNPERIPRWFLPVSGELKLGGKYQLEGQAGGTITRCDAPHGFDATWEYAGDVSWIELRLTAEGDDRTRFELTHIAHVDDERWTEFGPGAVGVGWDSGLMGMATYLSSDGSGDPAVEGAAWAASEDGKQFMKASSDAWADADIVAGTDPERARTLAANTYAAYTGA